MPNLGGVERYTYNLAKQLVKNDIDVTVVTNNIFDLSDTEIIDDIRVIRLPCINLLNGRFPVPKVNRLFRSLMHVLKNEHFDFVIVQTRFYPHSVIAARFAKKKNIPCIVIEHGTSHLSIDNRFWDKVGQIYEHVETAILKLYCKNYYGVSKACCEWSKHFHIEPKGVLYNSVDVEAIQKQQQDSVYEFREKYARDGTIVISFAGRLVPEKGVLQLIEAVTAVNQSGFKLKLLIAGDGPLYQDLANQNLQHAVLLGKLNFDQMIILYEASDIFCLPSKSEGFPTTVLEAAACKCFVITTERGGAKELITGDEYGIIIKDNTVENIKAAILKAMDGAYRKKATEKTYARLCESFTWEKTCERVMQIQGKMEKNR